MQMLEAAKVAETYAKKVIGHSVPSITYGLYAGGLSLNIQREIVMEAIEYPRLPPAP